MKSRFSSSHVKNLSKAVRIPNLIILVFAQYFAVIFLINPEQNWHGVILDHRLFLLSLSTVLIAAGGYMINDYYDIKIDYVNRPHKVVIGRGISRRTAIAMHSTLNFFGIAIGIFLSPWIGLVNLTSATLLWWYSNYLKRQPLVGNIVIGILSGAAVLLVTFLYPYNLRMVVLYAFFAAFFSMVRELIKDIEDRSGDEKFGCRTLPIVWGVRKTKILIYGLLVLFYVSFTWSANFYMGGNWLTMSFVLAILIGFFLNRLRFADTRKDYSNLSLYCKLILFLGIISMIFTT